MLLIDGVKYELWTPPSEDEFERIVKEHARDIFGEQSEYFGKQKMESKLGKGSVPDGFVIMFGEPPCWHIVEVELSFHDLHRHIVEQASRFIIGIKNPQTQRKIVDAIYEEIKKDDFLERKVRKASGTADIYKLLTELISKPPVLTIIIEKRTEELNEALSALAHPQIKVLEFKTFVREGVGLGAHAHLFEPLRPITLPNLPPPKPDDLGPIISPGPRVTLQYLISKGLISPGQRLFKTYKGKRYEAEIMTGGQLGLLHDNTEWESLSEASKHITGTEINGWKWWHVLVNGQVCSMDDLRSRLKRLM
jgi:hypothetical protein